MDLKKIIVLLSVLSFCIVSSAIAQKPISDISNRFGLSLRLNNISPDLDSYKHRTLDEENQIMFGGALIYGINSWLSCELAFDGSSSIEIKDKTYNVKLADLQVYPLTFSLQFRYISKSPEIYKWIVPYATVGLGYYFAKGDEASEYKTYNTPNKVSIDFDGGFGWHIGVGMDFFATKNLAIGIEGRYFKTSITIDEKQENPILNIVNSTERDIDMDGWIAGVNIKFFF